ncbi:IclR family transcriptional regulator domain-containing protein [Actinokineospora sp.]|uniref:IclR family transcriptional regulator domain-containing protein n=1 Tax=Actinokineospora sp. TaxID=1872133 RepID=UPI0040382B27
MVKPVEDKDYIQSLERGLSVILAFSDHHPKLTLGQVAELTGLSRPTVRRIVLTLERLGYLRVDGRQFALTPHVLALGHAYLSSLNLTEVARPYLEEVTRATGQTCSLATLAGADAVLIARVPDRPVLRMTPTTGTRLPAYATSTGRVLLADLRDAEIDGFLATASMPPLTAHTITDPERLRAVLTLVRDQGWAFEDQEFEEGVRSLSAPIHESEGRVVAALSMSVPARAVSLETIHADYLPVVVTAAREISDRLGAGHRS